ncbi:MAG: hypothetical protein M1822_006399 [Bathelium mastoideum]|nr:MAG: hypothetical protein M1822_006399 [Bathelium mastoideum]
MEELQARHRKEQRELQSKITQKKKSATKKTRKGVNDECANLEQQLKERQSAELASLNSHNSEEEAANNHSQGQDVDIVNKNEDDDNRSEPDAQTKETAADVQASPAQIGESASRKPNRQKARLARRAAEQEAVAAQAAEEAASMPDEREKERTQMLSLFEQRGLKEHEVRADGHCLYSAIADQMQQLGLGLSRTKATNEDLTKDSGRVPDYLQVRHAAANYITSKPDDFSAFLEEPLDEYVHKVRDTGEWGGQLELTALANAYELEINVLQGNGRVEKIAPQSDKNGKQVWLAYYRHGFGLGEHYNSLRKGP